MIRLDWGSVPEVDAGLVAEVWNRAIAKVVEDIADRPREGGKRVVVLECVVTPTKIEGEVGVAFNINSKTPKAGTTPYTMKMGAKQSLLFAPMSPDSPDQMELELEGVEESAEQRLGDED